MTESVDGTRHSGAGALLRLQLAEALELGLELRDDGRVRRRAARSAAADSGCDSMPPGYGFSGGQSMFAVATSPVASASSQNGEGSLAPMLSR